MYYKIVSFTDNYQSITDNYQSITDNYQYIVYIIKVSIIIL